MLYDYAYLRTGPSVMDRRGNLVLYMPNGDYSELEIALKQIHPYETPEIVAVPITACSKEYLDWLADELAEE